MGTGEWSVTSGIMKRTREVIQGEREEIRRKAQALDREWNQHPDTIREEILKKRQRLVNKLPLSLHPVLLDVDFDTYGILISLDIEENLEDKSGNAVYIWCFHAQFTKRAYSIAVDTTTQCADKIRFRDFSPVDFQDDALALWENALDFNDIYGHEEVGRALAAFCYACAEEIDDFDAYPVLAFPIGKHKYEVGLE